MKLTCPNCKVELRPSKDSPKMMQCPTCPFNLCPNERKLERMYAWVSVDHNGFEGIVACMTPSGMAMPMINSDLEMILKFKDMAHGAVKPVGMKAHIVKFERVGTILK